MTQTTTITEIRYEPIPADSIPAKVRFDVPRRNQGQIVEVAYGGFSRYAHDEGDEYKRVVDRSVGVGRVTYYRRAADAAPLPATTRGLMGVLDNLGYTGGYNVEVVQAGTDNERVEIETRDGVLVTLHYDDHGEGARGWCYRIDVGDDRVAEGLIDDEEDLADLLSEQAPRWARG